MGSPNYMTACPDCRKNNHDKSGDNLGVFDNGTFCFRCKTVKGKVDKDVEVKEKPKKKAIPLQTELEFVALPHRKISRETCLKYGYGVATDDRGNKWEVAPFYDEDSNLQAQKAREFGTTRSQSKKLLTFGDGSEKRMFGRQLVAPGGPVLVITEGELDAMSVYEANDCKYPALSLPDGSGNASNVIARDMEYINSFDRVVFMFDMDEEGQKAAKEAAGKLRPGKAYIAKLPLKDANECLINNKKADIITQVWRAEPYRPDGIVHIKDVKVSRGEKASQVFLYPFSSITRATFGRRPGEVTMLTSGSGMGKSTFVRKMIHFDLEQGHNVGAIMLEERTTKTKQDIMSVHLGKPIHKILAAEEINRSMNLSNLPEEDFGFLPQLSDDELTTCQTWLDTQPLFVFDHFGSLELDILTQRIEYLHYVCGCNIIYLDHVSIVVSGNDGDERRELDKLMTTLKSLAERTGVVITAVCHLKKAQNTSFEEGAQISLNDLRGSGALYQLADCVIGFERNQQAEDKDFANTMGIRLLKDRFGGNTGLKAALRFDEITQNLVDSDLETYKQKIKESNEK